MPDGLDFSYSDPRFLRQKIKALEKDIETLKKQVVPFAIHQRGPVVGSMRAIAINDQGLKASMWMNFTNIGPGVGPYAAVSDANGTIRAEWGNLAANGASPAQEGFRTNDGNGLVFFDTQNGLYPTRGVIGTPVTNASQSGVTGNGSFQVVSGATTSFTLSRAAQVLILGAGTVVDPTVGDTGFNLTCSLLVDGSATGPTFAPGTASFTATPWAVATLSATSHTAAFAVNQTNTHLWTAINVYVTALLIGG